MLNFISYLFRFFIILLEFATIMADNMYSFGVKNTNVLYISSFILPKWTQQNRIYAKKKLQKFVGAHFLKPEIE